jgi:hypothetical protein
MKHNACTPLSIVAPVAVLHTVLCSACCLTYKCRGCVDCVLLIRQNALPSICTLLAQLNAELQWPSRRMYALLTFVHHCVHNHCVTYTNSEAKASHQADIEAARQAAAASAVLVKLSTVMFNSL